MHKKYAKDGLVVVSVSVDEDVQDPEVQTAVRAWLQRNNGGAFTNVWLNEKPEFWQDKLNFTSLPCAFVFNREGKWYKFNDEKDVAQAVEKQVVELLQQK